MPDTPTTLLWLAVVPLVGLAWYAHRLGRALLRPIPLAILIVGWAASIGLLVVGQIVRRDATATDFEAVRRNGQRSVEQRIERLEDVLSDGAAFVTAIPVVDLQGWRTFFQSVVHGHAAPGVLRMFVVYPVARAGIPAFEARVRRAGVPEFRVHAMSGLLAASAQARPEEMTAVMTFIAPADGTHGAVGLDLGSDSARWRAVTAARDSGSGRLTSRTRWQDDVRARYVAFMPVYRAGALLGSTAERRAALIAWVATPMIPTDLLHDVLGARGDRLRLDVFDGTALDSSSVIFRSAGSDGPIGRYAATSTLTILGRPFTLGWNAGPGFAAASPRPTTTVGLLLAFLTLFLARLAVDEEQRTTRLEHSVREQSDRVRDSENRYRELADSLPVGLVVRAPSRGIVFCNRRALTLLGLTESQLLGRSALDPEWCMLRPDRTPFPESEFPINVALSTGLAQRDVVMGVLDPGTTGPRWMLVQADPQLTPDGRVREVICTFSDITMQQTAEQRLRQSERELRDAERVAHVGHWTWDMVRDRVSGSDEMQRIWGRTIPEEGISPMELLEASVHPEDRGRLHFVREDFQRGQPAERVELRIIRGDGHERRAVLITGNVARAADDAPLSVSGIVEDVTDLRAAEAHRALLAAQLLQAQKLESVGLLAGGVAHDFNNMLSVIIGEAEFAQMQLPADHPVHEDLQQILGAASRSADLTRQLLAFARRQEMFPRMLDVNAAVSESLRLLQRLIGENIELRWAPGYGLWPVYMDASHLGQILTNLCANARDAIADVGSIEITSSNEVVDPTFCERHADARPGEFVRLKLTDSGRGMSPEVLANCFDPFFTTKAAGKGTGLGLATVYGAVRQNDGFLVVESHVGAGTTFDIYLPRCSEVRRIAHEEERQRPPSRGSERILVVEDQPEILRMTSRHLSQLGYDVLSAATPHEALDQLRASSVPVALLLTDVVMPGMNGVELARHAVEIMPGIRELFMSGFSNQSLDPLIADGVERRFLAKPFTVATLASRVRAALDAA